MGELGLAWGGIVDVFVVFLFSLVNLTRELSRYVSIPLRSLLDPCFVSSVVPCSFNVCLVLKSVILFNCLLNCLLNGLPSGLCSSVLFKLRCVASDFQDIGSVFVSQTVQHDVVV